MVGHGFPPLSETASSRHRPCRSWRGGPRAAVRESPQPGTGRAICRTSAACVVAAPRASGTASVQPANRSGAGVRIAVKPDPSEPRRVVDEVERFCLERGLSNDIIFRFQLSLDELLTNVVSYGFEGVKDDPVITVDIRLGDADIEITIRDNGQPFNPLEDAETPDISLAAEDRPIGGLGIHLTKSFIDTLAYERVEGFNCLTLRQPLGAAGTEESPDEH
ncbi:MAG: ATP-binding protein [Gemmatimonadales bacterium]|nr:ATP-binding protein [Candidatus Palauibacter irciniicola]MYC17740.1 ATP-binding protein [Gemmatimonadales bacterium]